MRAAGRLANVVFAVCCVVLAGLGAVRAWPSRPAHSAREHVLEEGSPDPLAGSGPRRPGPVLYVFVSSTCPVCDGSLPFYKRLGSSAARLAPSRLVFVGLEPEASIKAYLQRGGVPAAEVLSIFHPPGVPGTPSIVSVDGSGRVRRSWAGRLSAAQEEDVLAALNETTASGQNGTVADWLARARSQLRGTRGIESVSAIDIGGTETLLGDGGSRINPYEFSLHLPASLRLRTGPLLHVLEDGRYSRRLVDAQRYGGPMVDRLLADPGSIATAAHGMQSHLMRLSLTYLCRAPTADVTEDQGTRVVGSIRGHVIAFKNTAERLEAAIVLDPATAQPLAVVTPVHNSSGPGAGTDDTWLSVLEDYRDVGGVRLPHRIEEWIGTSHSRVVLTSVKVDGR